MATKITVITNGKDGEIRERIFSKNEIRIGRGLYSDIVLDSLDVSTNHAIITINEVDNKRSLSISDLGSSSGTRLEGAPIPSRFAIQMSPTQRVEIGGFTIKIDFVLDQAKHLSQNLKTATGSATLLNQETTPSGNVLQTTSASSDIPRSNAPSPLEDNSAKSQVLSHNAIIDERDLAASVATKASNRDPVEPPKSNKPAFTPSLPIVEASKEAAFKSIDVVTKDNVSSSITSGEVSAKALVSHQSPTTPLAVEVSSTLITADRSESPIFELDDLEIEDTVVFDVNGTILIGNRPMDAVSVDAGQVGNTLTNVNGRFFFEQVQDGTRLDLVFEKAGYRFFPEKIEATITSNSCFFINAVEIVDLRGKITRLDKGIHDANVVIGNVGVVKTSADGSFAVSGIPANSFVKISFEKDGFVFEPPAWEGIVRSGSSPVSVKGIQLVSLTGRLLRAGRPLAGVEIEGGHYGRAITGPDGRYTFCNIREDMNASVSQSPGTKSFVMQVTPKTSITSNSGSSKRG